MARTRSERRQDVIAGVAEAMLFAHPLAHRRPDAVASTWRQPGRAPTVRQIRNAGCPGKALEAIASGAVGYGDPPWTGGFLLGLRLGGGLRRERARGARWTCPAIAPAPLRDDILRTPYAGGAVRDADGSVSLTRCRWLGLPAEDPQGLDVLAGVMAAGRLVQATDGTWVGVPATEAVAGLVEALGLNVEPWDSGLMRLSPFYGALVAGRMPTECAFRMYGIGQAGGCPGLAVAMWEVVFGRRFGRLPPESWALPWACGPATATRMGLTREVAHRMAVGMGAASPSPAVRVACEEWAAGRGLVEVV